jgi:hypothetical protein
MRSMIILPFLLCGLTLLGMALCYLSVLSQKRHIEAIDGKIHGYRGIINLPSTDIRLLSHLTLEQLL